MLTLLFVLLFPWEIQVQKGDEIYTDHIVIMELIVNVINVFPINLFCIAILLLFLGIGLLLIIKTFE
jgi:hypothetical protein